ncbi:unnamed protein product, partial [Brugia pahangi]|uniref:Sugar transporter SWEET1 n=1 Tax=Brugia pahangi TaxID=6280 RepID=A0A0N4TKV7_BRUPA
KFPSFIANYELFQSQGTTNGISSAPFHTGFLSGQLWLQYGLLKHDKVFNRCIRLLFMEVIFLMSAYYYIHYYGLQVEVIHSRLGLCCVILNILTVAAPLEALHEVFRTRCTETMPLPLCCLTFLVTTEWLLYGILIDDIYIKVIPNAIASVIAAVQLLPFLYFPRNKQKAAIIIS